MKREISSLELNYIIKELSVLIDAKLNNSYQTSDGPVYLVFHKPNHGKVILKIMHNFLYLPRKKEPTETPSGFSMFLRKYLNNTRLRSIRQIGSERIVEIIFESFEKKYRLLIELYGQGNIILCDEGLIIGCLTNIEDKDRITKKNEIYQFPKQRVDILRISFSEFDAIIQNSSQESIVKTLAADLGLGGMYSEELCLIAGVDKKSKQVDTNILFEGLQTLVNHTIDAQLVLENSKIIDAVPFKLNHYAKKEFKSIESFSWALEELLTVPIVQVTKTDKELKKALNIIKAQKETLIKLEKDIIENTEKGNKLYENYQMANDILMQVKDAKKKIGLTAMQEKIKDNKFIKKITNEKIVVDL